MSLAELKTVIGVQLNRCSDFFLTTNETERCFVMKQTHTHIARNNKSVQRLIINDSTKMMVEVVRKCTVSVRARHEKTARDGSKCFWCS